MASVRINNSIRDEIWARIKKDSAWAEEEAALVRKMKILSQKAYDLKLQILGIKLPTMESLQAEFKKFQEKIPKGIKHKENFFSTDDDIMVEAQGQRARFNFNGSISTRDNWASGGDSEYKLMFTENLQLEVDHPIWLEFLDIQKSLDDLRKRIDDARYEAYTVMNSVTTINKLIEAWPEIEPYAKDFGAPPKSTALAIQTKRLNGMLGLPKGEQK